ncbi:Protein quiver [Taenia solium]|eukprot:TsM_000715500 transcript=TsM_000715500 gene=TsM_000715500
MRMLSIRIAIDESVYRGNESGSRIEVYRFLQPFELGVNSIPSVHATDPDSICPVQSILCVECRSDLHPYCRDPFNRTLLHFNEIPYKMCNGYCVNAVQPTYYQLNCYEKSLFRKFPTSIKDINAQVSAEPPKSEQ